MKDINTLRVNSNGLKSNLEGQKFKDIVDIFINSLYKPSLKENSYSIKVTTPKDENFINFININKKLVYKYANNIKKNYDEKLLDPENEYANIYLYIVESLYIFFKNHCDSDIELLKSYIKDRNKTYVNSEGKEYTFAKYMYMSVKRMIIEENKLYEKTLEKGCMNESNRFARIDLDATVENEDGKAQDIELYSMGLFTLLHDEDVRSSKEILKDNIQEMKRIQEKLSSILTKSQVEFIVTETYGCYFDIDLNDFIMKQYSKQQRNQYFHQISKRINRDVKPFFIKKHNKKYVDKMIEYRRNNRKKLDATPRNIEDYINNHSSFKVSNVKINT